MDKPLSRTNPLVAGGGVGEDTCCNVQFVLQFVRDAFYQAAATGDAFNESAMIGAGHILDVCSDALQWTGEPGQPDTERP